MAANNEIRVIFFLSEVERSRPLKNIGQNPFSRNSSGHGAKNASIYSCSILEAEVPIYPTERRMLTKRKPHQQRRQYGDGQKTHSKDENDDRGEHGGVQLPQHDGESY